MLITNRQPRGVHLYCVINAFLVKTRSNTSMITMSFALMGHRAAPLPAWLYVWWISFLQTLLNWPTSTYHCQCVAWAYLERGGHGGHDPPIKEILALLVMYNLCRIAWWFCYLCMFSFLSTFWCMLICLIDWLIHSFIDSLIYSILFYSKTSRLGRRKCQSTTRAPNNIVSVKSTIE